MLIKEYKSTNEKIFAKMLEMLKIDFTYEPETIDLIPAEDGTLGRYKPRQYTPDFWLPKYNLMVETKGFKRGADNLICRLADCFYKKQNIKYLVITQAGSLKNNNKDFYLYEHKGIPKRGQKTRTFWEILQIEKDTHQIFLEAKEIIKNENKEKSND